MLESAYQKCLAHELTRRGYKVVCEVVLPIKYEGEIIESGYRIDMCIEDCILIENKTVEKILPIHEAQLLTYLRLSKIRLGFILNWYSTLMKDGIKRMVIY
jgi:GxxExxY protein